MDISGFLALRTGKVPGWKYRHQVRGVGELKLPSGRLETSDPLVNLGEGAVFSVAPGSYPVMVTLADVSPEQDGSHLRTTYLSVLVADGEVARVDHLIPDGMEPLIGESRFYYLPVESGAVGFADADAVTRCMPDPDTWDELFFPEDGESWSELSASPAHHADGCANVVMPLAIDGENIVFARSGWGDGMYPVLGSYDADGRLLGIHVDLLVDEPEGSISISPQRAAVMAATLPADAAVIPGAQVSSSLATFCAFATGGAAVVRAVAVVTSLLSERLGPSATGTVLHVLSYLDLAALLLVLAGLVLVWRWYSPAWSGSVPGWLGLLAGFGWTAAVDIAVILDDQADRIPFWLEPITTGASIAVNICVISAFAVSAVLFRRTATTTIG